MSNQEFNFEDLGEKIQRIIDRAVYDQDYDKLNQTIRQAVENGTSTLRRVVESASQPSTKTSPVPVPRRNPPMVPPRPASAQPMALGLYASTTPNMVKGVLQTVSGGVLTFLGGVGLLLSGIFGAVFGSGFPVTFPLLLGTGFLSGGGILLGFGVNRLGMMARFRKYRAVLGNQTHCEIIKLSRVVGKPARFVAKDVRKLIDKGMFLEGHLDEQGTSLIVSDETYTHYRQLQQRQQQEALEAAKQVLRGEPIQPQIQDVLDQGNAFLAEIRQCNDAIPGEEISGKISRMEVIVGKIFDRAKQRPEVVPELKKLQDYYLPMTVKLLKAYAEMDAQPIQGTNIAASKREIEATLDTLNNAFEKLLDQVFKKMAVDVSSDITVLQTLLAQEGLTEDGFTK